MQRFMMIRKSMWVLMLTIFGFAGILNAGHYGKRDIVETAVSAGSFNMLAAAECLSIR